MSSLAATTSAVYCSVCETIAKLFKGTFRSFAVSRQIQANRIVAEELIRSGDYHPNDATMYTLWNELNRKTIKEYYPDD